MGATFEHRMRVAPRNASDDVGWQPQINDAMHAIDQLLRTVKDTRRLDPQREYVLHNRHAAQLAVLKRMCDAACM